MVADLDSFPSIPAAFFAIAENKPELVVYAQAELLDGTGGREWRDTSYTKCASRVKKIAAYLRTLEVAKGDTIAIISQSRPEWMEADIAILSVGGISVSVYQSLPADDVGYILFDSKASIVFAENQEQLDKLEWLLQNDITITATEERPQQSVRIQLKKIITFEQTSAHPLTTSVQTIFDSTDELESAALAQLSREDLAALVYTSGTTGAPKGVMQTHGNHLANCRQAWSARLLEDGYTIMVFLPLAHAFAKLMGYIGFLSEGVLKFPVIIDPKSSRMDPNSVTRDIREGSANVVPIVPRLLEKMQSGITARSNGSGLQAKLLAWTLWSSRELYRARQRTGVASPLVQIVYHGRSEEHNV